MGPSPAALLLSQSIQNSNQTITCKKIKNNAQQLLLFTASSFALQIQNILKTLAFYYLFSYLLFIVKSWILFPNHNWGVVQS